MVQSFCLKMIRVCLCYRDYLLIIDIHSYFCYSYNVLLHLLNIVNNLKIYNIIII